MKNLHVFWVLPIFFCFTACSSETAEFQGYAEAEYVYLSSSRLGKLEKLHVVKGQNVPKGMLLCELEKEPEQTLLRQAEENEKSISALLSDMQQGKRPQEIAMAKAMLNQAQTEAKNAEILLERNEKLAKTGAISKQELDDYRTRAKASKERVAELQYQVEIFSLPEREDKIKSQKALLENAKAKTAQAKWDLQQKKIFAPNDGLIFDILYREGENVPAGYPVLWFFPQGSVKVRFYVPESMLSSMSVGKKVRVRADGKEDFQAIISYISPQAEYTPPVIYSNETRAKLIYMLEAYPEDGTGDLHPGQPLAVMID